jgi:hypothetical protein
MSLSPNAVAGSLFRGPDALNHACRRAISEIASSRQWLDLAIEALADVESAAWRDLGELRALYEDPDGPGTAERNAELVGRFAARASSHAQAAFEAIRAARVERGLSLLAEQAARRRDE